MFWSKEADDIHLDLVVPFTNKNADGITKWIESEGIPFWERVCATLQEKRERLCVALQKKREQILPRARASTPSNRNSHSFATLCTNFFLKLRQKISNESQVSEKPEECPGNEKYQIVTYRYRTLLAFTTFVTTIFASLLPIVAIVVLSKLHKQSMILGFIALFTGLFTMGLMMLTPSGTKRTEIFTASAA
jgi:VIT1/CCC1 family predicted Fe2+/Mn2+ transporter